MNRCRHVAGSTRHAAVSYQRDLEPFALQGSQRWSELMQLRHPVGARTLVANDDYDIARQFACLECLDDIVLCVKDSRRRFDHAMLVFDSGRFDYRAPEVSSQELEA